MTREHEWVHWTSNHYHSNIQCITTTNSQMSRKFKAIKNSYSSPDPRSTLMKTFTNRPRFWNFLMVWADATWTAGYTETVLKTLERLKSHFVLYVCLSERNTQTQTQKECIRNQYWDELTRKSETTNLIIFVQAYLLATSHCIWSNEEPGIALIAICSKNEIVSHLFSKRAANFQWHDTVTADDATKQFN